MGPSRDAKDEGRKYEGKERLFLHLWSGVQKSRFFAAALELTLSGERRKGAEGTCRLASARDAD